MKNMKFIDGFAQSNATAWSCNETCSCNGEKIVPLALIQTPKT